MKKTIPFWLVVVVGLVGSGPAKSQQENSSEVRKCLENLIGADNRSDVQAVLECYHGNAELWPPNGMPIVGKQAIEQNYRKLFDRETLVLTSSIAEVHIAENFAVVTGVNTGEHRYKDGTSRPIRDKYIAILIKESNRWKISKLIWSGNPIP